MKKKGFLAVLLVVFLHAYSSASAATFYTDVVVLGDSLSDQGNVFTITGELVPPLEYTDGTNFGRFTNGLNYVDDLVPRLGHTITPSVLGGSNFAYGGARTDSHPIPGALSLLQQRDAFADRLGGAPADPNALHVVWAGANNLRDIILAALADPSFDPAPDLTKAVTDVSQVVGSLAGLGAKNIFVPNMPNLGVVPIVTQGGPPVPAATALSATYNSFLDGALDGIEAIFTDVDLIRFDTFGLLTEIFLDPGMFGFTNATDPCYSLFVAPGGDTCSNPAEYVSWDGFHPTAAAHEMLAERMFAAVTIPEPATPILFALGIAGVGVARRCKRTE